MDNMDKKEETVTDLVPADQNPEETKVKDDEFTRAMVSLCENGMILQKDGVDFINVGQDQLKQIQLIETCLKEVEDSAPKEWLSSLQENLRQIFEILNPGFNPEIIEKVTEVFQTVDTHLEQASAQGEQATIECSYQVFRQMRDLFAQASDKDSEKRSEFNQINQWISEILDKLKEQNLEEIFGDALPTLETSLATLQENGELMETKNAFIMHLNESNVQNFTDLCTGFEKLRKEKYGIEGDMVKLSITDGDGETKNEEGDNSKEEETEDAKEEGKKLDEEFN